MNESAVIPESSILRCREPGFREQRGDSRLLVWGDLPDWMVIDSELESFLGSFDGKMPLGTLLDMWASRGGVREQAAAIASELARRGILATPASKPGRASDPVLISNVTFNLTNRCNLKCPWCYNDARGGDEVPIPVLAESIARSASLLDPAASLIILGGEPFLDLNRLLETIDRVGSLFQGKATVSTNGTLLTNRAASEMAGRRIEVQVSLDSPDHRIHDSIRGKDVFDKATAGARRLSDAGVRTILSMVYTRSTVDSFEQYLDLAASLGCAEARFIPMRLVGRGREHAAMLPDQLVAFENLVSVLEKRPDLRRLLLRDFFSITMTTLRHAAPRTNCGIGRKVAFVDADGLVYPCPNHVSPRFLCGGVVAAPLAEIMLRSRVMRTIRDEYHVSNYGACAKCPFRQWCAGDCRGEVLASTGSVSGPSPHCAELRRVFARMLWMLSSADPVLATPSNPHDGRNSGWFRH